MRHFTHIADVGGDGAWELIERAQFFKRHGFGRPFAERLLAMLFFNPSLRTRASFEAAMIRGGGNAMIFDVGKGLWPLETSDGAVMDGDRSEHIREAAPVLGRYADALAVRSFAKLEDHDSDHADGLMRAFRELAGVPVVNMESAREHPCQGLADLLTLRESFGDLHRLPVTLTWAPHIKPLPRAVPNSFLLTAVALGCEVRVAHPPGFDLHQGVLDEARELAGSSGGSFSVTHDQYAALDGAAAVYVKSWGPTAVGATSVAIKEGTAAIAAEAAPTTLESELRVGATSVAMERGDVMGFPDWTITLKHLRAASNDAFLMHCLPVRRNLVVADAVLDREPKKFLDQAENRMHVQAAVLDWLWNG